MRVRRRARETRGRDGDREESEGSRERSGSGEGLALPSPCVTALGREKTNEGRVGIERKETRGAALRREMGIEGEERLVFER